MWLGLDAEQNFIYTLKYEAEISNLITPIANYFSTNYPGQTTVYELSNYFSSVYDQTIYYVALDYDTIFIFDSVGNLLDQYIISDKKASRKSKKEKQLNGKKLKKVEIQKKNSVNKPKY